MAQTDYFAGLFEGEGSVSIQRSRTRKSGWQWWLLVQVTMGDSEPLEALREHWAGTIATVLDHRGRRRTMYRWHVSARQAAVFLAAIEPALLTDRVRAKVALGLRFQAQKQVGGWRDDVYLARQDSYYTAMRELNRRGVDTITPARRLEILSSFS